jgi:DNA-binding transcriptional regulator YiaG
VRDSSGDTAIQLKGLREDRLLSQEALARLVGVSVRTVARWENGYTRPSPLALLKLQELGPQELSIERERR